MGHSSNKICVIGGSGIYDLLKEPSTIEVETPFAESPVKVYFQNIEGKEVFFLPRHGGKHSIPPHKINFKANIFALHKLGITRVLSTNAVGSLNKNMKPGDYVILSDFIDFTYPITFFDGKFVARFSGGFELKGVIHLDMTEPYCPEIRESFLRVLKDKKHHSQGIYLRTMGPRFETPAEIYAIRQMGADVVGMTNPSEAILCRELGICYGTIAVITNFAAGMQKALSHQEVLDIFQSRVKEIKQLFFDVIKELPAKRGCNCFRHTVSDSS
ncbi:MAG: phosphorylase family protein [Candidatus Hodarchaeales archaeon]